ncbi:MAG: hypothetical protein ABH885_05270, partial [Candidatus Omnitrophota bacterium]
DESFKLVYLKQFSMPVRADAVGELKLKVIMRITLTPEDALSAEERILQDPEADGDSITVNSGGPGSHFVPVPHGVTNVTVTSGPDSSLDRIHEFDITILPEAAGMEEPSNVRDCPGEDAVHQDIAHTSGPFEAVSVSGSLTEARVDRSHPDRDMRRFLLKAGSSLDIRQHGGAKVIKSRSRYCVVEATDKGILIWDKVPFKPAFNAYCIGEGIQSLRGFDVFEKDGRLTIVYFNDDNQAIIWKETGYNNFVRHILNVEHAYRMGCRLENVVRDSFAFQGKDGLLTLVVPDRIGMYDGKIRVYRENPAGGFEMKLTNLPKLWEINQARAVGAVMGDDGSVILAAIDNVGYLIWCKETGDGAFRVMKTHVGQDAENPVSIKFMKDEQGDLTLVTQVYWGMVVLKEKDGRFVRSSGPGLMSVFDPVRRRNNKFAFLDGSFGRVAYYDEKTPGHLKSIYLGMFMKGFSRDKIIDIAGAEGEDGNISMAVSRADRDIYVFEEVMLDGARPTVVGEFVERGTGIISETDVANDLKRVFRAGMHGMLLLEPGAREGKIISDFAGREGYRMSHLECTPEMGDLDLIGGPFPVVGEGAAESREVAEKPGFLGRHLYTREDLDKHTEKKLLVLHNIDALPEKIRASLNNFLLNGYVERKDDSGRVRQYYLPANTRILVTLSSESQREFSSAFYNRFIKIAIPALNAREEGFSELLQELINGMRINEREARTIQDIFLSIKGLEEGGHFWPSGREYNFTVKDALLHAQFVRFAMDEARARGLEMTGDRIDRIIASEAIRLYGGMVSRHAEDYSNFMEIIMKGIFPHALVEELSGEFLRQEGLVTEVSGVPLPGGRARAALEEIDMRYRLTMVPRVVRTMSSVLRGW